MADLLAETFPEPRWAVPGIVAEGVTLLAGPPKAGKSWLALGLAVSVATGGKALGQIDVEPGPTLYLGLEDTPRRLKDRLSKVLAGAHPGTEFEVWTEHPSTGPRGEQRVGDWLEANPKARLVVVDVLARMRPRADRNESAYDADYRAVAQAKTLADAYSVPMVVIHHVRKAASEDFLNEVSGTHGLAGASDAVAVLKRARGKADGLLQMTGRDIEESSYALSFAADLGAWQLSDTPVDEVLLGDTRAAILKHLKANEGDRPKQIAEVTGLDYELVKKTVKRMAADGQLDGDGQGRYFPVPTVPPVPDAGQRHLWPVPEVSPEDQ